MYWSFRSLVYRKWVEYTFFCFQATPYPALVSHTSRSCGFVAIASGFGLIGPVGLKLAHSAWSQLPSSVGTCCRCETPSFVPFPPSTACSWAASNPPASWSPGRALTPTWPVSEASSSPTTGSTSTTRSKSSGWPPGPGASRWTRCETTPCTWCAWSPGGRRTGGCWKTPPHPLGPVMVSPTPPPRPSLTTLTSHQMMQMTSLPLSSSSLIGKHHVSTMTILASPAIVVWYFSLLSWYYACNTARVIVVVVAASTPFRWKTLTGWCLRRPQRTRWFWRAPTSIRPTTYQRRRPRWSQGEQRRTPARTTRDCWSWSPRWSTSVPSPASAPRSTPRRTHLSCRWLITRGWV